MFVHFFGVMKDSYSATVMIYITVCLLLLSYAIVFVDIALRLITLILFVKSNYAVVIPDCW